MDAARTPPCGTGYPHAVCSQSMTTLRAILILMFGFCSLPCMLPAQTTPKVMSEPVQSALIKQDWKRAERVLRSELRSNPRDLDRQTLLAICLMRQQKFDAALRQAELITRSHPQAYAAHMIAAECHMRLGQTDKALDIFRLARTIAPDSAEPAMALGMILSSTGRFDEAITFLEESLFRRPGNMPLTMQLVRCYLRLGRASEAAELATRAAELAPGDANAQMMAGEALMASRRTEQAIDFLQQAIRLGVGSSSPHMLLTIALQDNGRTDEALAVARAYVQGSQDDPQGWYNVGLLQLEKMELDSSLRSLKKAVGLKPNYPEAYYNLGRVYDGLGFGEDAIQSYRRAAAPGGNFAADAYLGMALIYRKSGNFTEAIRAHSQSVSLRDTSQVMRVQRLQTCFEADRCADASGFIDKDVRDFPTSPGVLFEAARCFARTGRRSDAERILTFLDKESPALARDLRIFMSL
ncbi:MAG TPA: hypothetical protein DCZ59_05085 [Bacteroidetes bacterium]|nr:hypothetical protein [Bacteroidota bacterium]